MHKGYEPTDVAEIVDGLHSPVDVKYVPCYDNEAAQAG
jgi:hypothetical protein